jgi:hypothetical protein
MALIYYDEYFCKILKDRCQRGSLNDCPKPRGNLEIVCEYCIRKDSVPENE